MFIWKYNRLPYYGVILKAETITVITDILSKSMITVVNFGKVLVGKKMFTNVQTNA